jgi:hypothetical protein
MVIPSLYVSRDEARPWSVARAGVYGAGIGLLAALSKTLGLSHGALRHAPSGDSFVHIPEIVGAAAGFALLCAGAAVLRNLIARRLIWPEFR